jgi:hypothetical protein
MAQELAVDVVYVPQAEGASARLHTGDEMVSVSKVVNKEHHYHVLGEVIVRESTGNNSDRVSESRP